MTANSKKTAFSLIELSIVISVIGLILFGITKGMELVDSYRLSNARSQTKSSPVASIPDLALWLETTTKESFLDAQYNDGQKITAWDDINPQQSLKKSFLQGTSSAQPTYANKKINSLPVIEFNGSTQYFQISYDRELNPENFTMFLVVQSHDDASYDAIISSREDLPSGGYIFYGTSDGNYQMWLGDTGFWDIPTGGTVTINQTTILTGTRSEAAQSASFYQNSSLTGTIASNMVVNDSNNTRIGAGANESTAGFFFDGYIGEIILFARVLRSDEREEVENYLAKKWGVNL